MIQPYQFPRGETIFIGLRVKSGAATAEMFDRAVIKKAASNGLPPGDGAPEVMALNAVFTNAVGETPANWILTADSEGLDPGLYVADARFTVAGQVKIARYCRIEILPRVTRAAP
jgi:hypothetical protein